MGRVSLEAKIHEEAKYLIAELDSIGGKPLDLALHTPKAVSNIISSIIYGSRFDYEDEVFKANVKALDQSVRKQSLVGMVQFLPFLEFLPKVLPIDKQLAKNVKMRDDYAEEQINTHKDTFDPECARDYIDAYMIHMNEMKRNGVDTTFSG